MFPSFFPSHLHVDICSTCVVSAKELWNSSFKVFFHGESNSFRSVVLATAIESQLTSTEKWIMVEKFYHRRSATNNPSLGIILLHSGGIFFVPNLDCLWKILFQSTLPFLGSADIEPYSTSWNKPCETRRFPNATSFNI